MRGGGQARRARGFSLIEVLVAVVIFSVLALAAYGALNSVSRAMSASQEHERALGQLQMALSRLETDLQSLVLRPNFQGLPTDGLMGQSTEFEGVRSGWANPLGQPRSQLQRFRWRWMEGQLERGHWPTLQDPSRLPPQNQVVLDGVSAWSIRYLDPGGQWRDQWGGPQAIGLPRAVEFMIEHERFGTLRRRVVID